jgi:hypothetical protein
MKKKYETFSNLVIGDKIKFIIANNKQLIEDNTILLKSNKQLAKENRLLKQEIETYKKEYTKVVSKNKLYIEKTKATNLFIRFITEQGLKIKWDNFVKHKQVKYL